MIKTSIPYDELKVDNYYMYEYYSSIYVGVFKKWSQSGDGMLLVQYPSKFQEKRITHDVFLSGLQTNFNRVNVLENVDYKEDQNYKELYPEYFI